MYISGVSQFARMCVFPLIQQGVFGNTVSVQKASKGWLEHPDKDCQVQCRCVVYWAAGCSVLCSYWFGIGVLPCSTCQCVIWGDPESSLGVGLSNDRQLLIADEQLGRNSSVSKVVLQRQLTTTTTTEHFCFVLFRFFLTHSIKSISVRSIVKAWSQQQNVQLTERNCCNQ